MRPTYLANPLGLDNFCAVADSGRHACMWRAPSCQHGWDAAAPRSVADVSSAQYAVTSLQSRGSSRDINKVQLHLLFLTFNNHIVLEYILVETFAELYVTRLHTLFPPLAG